PPRARAVGRTGRGRLRVRAPGGRPGRGAVQGVRTREARVHAASHGRAVRPAGAGRRGRDPVREPGLRGGGDRLVPEPPAAPRAGLRVDGDLPAGGLTGFLDLEHVFEYAPRVADR